MFQFLFRWLALRKAHRDAVAAAVVHFERVRGMKAHAGICGVIAEEPNSYVVRVCYGHAKPPSRAWYRIGCDGEVSSELTFDEVQQFGEGHWR
jgi:hypothetical protein